ncbi:MAG: hypothetical protein AB1631_18515 [Acidobacteriota bacterium]
MNGTKAIALHLSKLILSIAIILLLSPSASASDPKVAAIERTRAMVEEIRSRSFPELRDAEIQIKTFRSGADYFRSRFGWPQFFFRRMRCIIMVNPSVFEQGAPESGIRAIIAHELAHALYYKNGNRLRLLGLVRLVSRNFTARFERAADLQAISRGYGEGLRLYREWLYGNVPPNKLDEKKRNYFSPPEIEAIMSAIEKRPELMKLWLRRAPRNLAEIEEQAKPRQ